VPSVPLPLFSSCSPSSMHSRMLTTFLSFTLAVYR
jgi:hypothetical protein